MFSKKPQLAVQAASAAPASQTSRMARLAALPLANPYIGAGAAAVLLFASLGVLIATGDPRAGAPSVLVALGQAAPSDIAVIETQAAGEFDASAIDMVPIDGGALADNPYGQAVITLPDGRQRMAPLLASADALPAAPLVGLYQTAPGGGMLPIIATDGRTPAQAYARPFVANGKPKIAIVIGGLGLNPERTRQAIALPPEVTLSFPVTSVPEIQSWINQARARGHEVLLEIPMEPKTYPQDDPGPDTLLANLRPEETWTRLDAILSRATGYFGVTNYLGSNYVTSNAAMDAFTTGLRRRGLAFIDDGSASTRGGGLPRASADRMIDLNTGRDTTASELSQLEQMARRKGYAVGNGFFYAQTLEQVAAWARGLPDRGFQLAPASAVTVRR